MDGPAKKPRFLAAYARGMAFLGYQHDIGIAVAL
jgi:hypothetical protein